MKGILGSAVAGIIAYHVAQCGRDFYQKKTDFLLKMKAYEDEILEKRARKLELLNFLEHSALKGNEGMNKLGL
jgi:hypothetical protein